MSKYFVRYSYDAIIKVPHGDGLGSKYETENVMDSCIFEMEEDNIDINEVRDYIFSYELHYLRESRPEKYNIDILVLNKL